MAIDSSNNPKYAPEVVEKFLSFIEESGRPMDELAAVCDRYNITDIKKVFVFTVTNDRYRIFLDHDYFFGLLSK